MNDYLHCLKQCEDLVYKCETCHHESTQDNVIQQHDMFLCVGCKIKCHTSDHTFEEVHVKDDLKKEVIDCMCTVCHNC